MTAWNFKPSLSSNLELVASGATTISAELLDATHIRVTYRTLMGNQPSKYENVISVWSGAQIGWRNQPTPVASVPVPKNTPDGDMVINLGSQPPPGGPPYMVAYGTSKSGTAYCAGQIVDPGQPQIPITTQMSAPWIGTDSLLAPFSTPAQNNPRAYGNWIGLWEGQGFTYNGATRIAKAVVDSDVASGSQSMNGLELTFNTLYTLGYSCGPRDEDLAAWITFKTQPFLLSLVRLLFHGRSRNSA